MNPTPSNRRRPEYLSPSALSCFEQDKIEYYRRYVSPVKPPKLLQTAPMSVGSAFDAYVKAYLHEAIYGKNHSESAKYSTEALLKAQVEPQNMEWARDAGKYCFQQYKDSGALADLMLELSSAVDDPRFEFEVKGVIEGTREGVSGKKMGVPLLGKPDLRYVNSEGAHVIHDWKVNGFCGKSNTSPMAGYIQCRDQTGYKTGAHKDAFLQQYKGLTINTGAYLETYNTDWATQLATYGWLLGEPIGKEFVVGVDQLACNGSKRSPSGHPVIRIAHHRIRISEKFQYEAMARFQILWGILTDEPFYFFRDLSFEESEKKCDMLDGGTALMANAEPGSDDEWIMSLGRTQ